MTNRIPLSRATTESTNSSNDDLLSLVEEEPIRYIRPTICTKPSYNIIEDRINMNNYHQVDKLNLNKSQFFLKENSIQIVSLHL